MGVNLLTVVVVGVGVVRVGVTVGVIVEVIATILMKVSRIDSMQTPEMRAKINQ